MVRGFLMPELTPTRLAAIEELGQMNLAELNHINEEALSEEQRKSNNNGQLGGGYEQN